jgi:hypothetical protein
MEQMLARKTRAVEVMREVERSTQKNNRRKKMWWHDGGD